MEKCTTRQKKVALTIPQMVSFAKVVAPTMPQMVSLAKCRLPTNPQMVSSAICTLAPKKRMNLLETAANARAAKQARAQEAAHQVFATMESASSALAMAPISSELLVMDCTTMKGEIYQRGPKHKPDQTMTFLSVLEGIPGTDRTRCG